MQTAEVQQQQHDDNGCYRNTCGRTFHGRREKSLLGGRGNRRCMMGGRRMFGAVQRLRDGRMYCRRVG